MKNNPWEVELTYPIVERYEKLIKLLCEHFKQNGYEKAYLLPDLIFEALNDERVKEAYIEHFPPQDYYED